MPAGPLEGGRVLLPHGYDAASARFVATGETPVATWSDPDGGTR